MPYKKSDVDYSKWTNAVQYEYGSNCMFLTLWYSILFLGLSLFRKNLFCASINLSIVGVN